jgi:aminomethyltransferase
MLQLIIRGKHCESFLESLVVGDIKGLKVNESRLSLFTAESGGIIDDSVITKRDGYLSVILNAGCAEKDMKHISEAAEKFEGQVELDVKRDYSLIALQGPEAAAALRTMIEGVDLDRLAFMSCVDATVAGVYGCTVSRSGYTGEDGFEISIPTDEAANKIAEALLEIESVKLAGLGARDTLRVEAGLCLYGSDIDEQTTPIEAGLAWTVSKRRRLDGGFPGAEIIMNQLMNGVSKKRVGFTVLNGPPARHGCTILQTPEAKEPIGNITSGTFSPTLGKPLAIGYVKTDKSAVGTELLVNVRGKFNPVVVTKMPFVPANYYRPN